ncbi:MAG: hypothetical protein DI535_13155 [Citrobacter freundii]|nr:MAG: hypothetical protein DI535_13155 [Citrobacter freundii]
MKRTTLFLGICCLLTASSCRNTHHDPLIDLRNNWYSFIRTEIPGYHFSGFENDNSVDVPVTNNTDYTLDEVVVSVNYIGEAGGIHRSEEVKVFNIPPHSIKTIKAPTAPSGMDIDIEIRNIMSRQMQFIYPGSSTNATDPYFFN